MASLRGCRVWPQLTGAAERSGRLLRKESRWGRREVRVASSAVMFTMAPCRCSRVSLMRFRSACTPSQSESILLACMKWQEFGKQAGCKEPCTLDTLGLRDTKPLLLGAKSLQPTAGHVTQCMTTLTISQGLD